LEVRELVLARCRIERNERLARRGSPANPGKNEISHRSGCPKPQQRCTPLASGPITNHDEITVVLVQPTDGTAALVRVQRPPRITTTTTANYPAVAAAITRIIADHEVIFRQPITPLIQPTVFQRWRDATNGSA
jgi:hypothetical protein